MVSNAALSLSTTSRTSFGAARRGCSGCRQAERYRGSHEVTTTDLPRSDRRSKPVELVHAPRGRSVGFAFASRPETSVIGSIVSCSFDFADMDDSPDGLETSAWVSIFGAFDATGNSVSAWRLPRGSSSGSRGPRQPRLSRPDSHTWGNSTVHDCIQTIGEPLLECQATAASDDPRPETVRVKPPDACGSPRIRACRYPRRRGCGACVPGRAGCRTPRSSARTCGRRLSPDATRRGRRS